MLASKLVIPSYLALGADEIRRRAERAIASLARCEVCPRNCRVNRLEGEARVCATGRLARVSTWFAHFGEEDCLRGTKGSGTIFFSFCNLKCVFCFHPDTRIATAQGQRTISELFEACEERRRTKHGEIGVVRNESVWTRGAAVAPMRRVFAHPFDGELVRVKPYCCPPLLLTPNHRVFAAHRRELDAVTRIPAAQLSRDHFLVVPKRRPGGENVMLDVASILSRSSRRTRRRRARRVSDVELVHALVSDASSDELGAALGYHPTYVRLLRSRLREKTLSRAPVCPEVLEEDGRVRFTGEHRPAIPSMIPLDEALAWLLGIFCAEGHVSSPKDRPNSARIAFSFGPHEHELIERTATGLAKIFGVTPSIVPRVTTITVECGKASLAQLFRELCGDGAGNKRVPVELLRTDRAIVRAFLDGYLAGDGTRTRTHDTGTTVSLDLALGLFELGLVLEVLPSFHAWTPRGAKFIQGRPVNESTLYYVKFKRDRLEQSADPSRERSKWKERGNAFLVPVHRIERVPYTGPVYNLEVDDDDHSYLAPFAAVANCQNHDTSQAGHGMEMTPARLADAMLDLQGQGCHNINFVTPEHVVPEILEALPLAIERGLRLPIVYNTSAYDSLESIALMDGIVDIYMPDFKVWTKQSAIRYLKAKDYPEVARGVVLAMHRQVGPLELGSDGLARRGVLVRHLVMPGLIDETRQIFEFLAREVSADTYVNVMGQYRPEYRAADYPEIARRPSAKEMSEARRLFFEAGLRRLDRRRASHLDVVG